MAYRLFGGAPSDFTITQPVVLASPSGTATVVAIAANASLEAWSAGSAGTQTTDLKLFTGSYTTAGSAAPSGIFTALSDGTVLVWAQDTVNELWVTGQGSSGQRWHLLPVDMHTRLRTVETSSVTSSPRPVFAQVLSVDAPTEWITAAASEISTASFPVDGM